jgi:hypothetical protein
MSETTEAIAAIQKPTASERQAAASAPQAAAWLSNPNPAPRALTTAQQLAAEPEWQGQPAA